MTTEVKTEYKEGAAEPIRDFKKTRYWRLWYHFRSSNPKDLVFDLECTFHEAIAAGRAHCDVMNYRFIKVRPFVVDLKEREKRRLEDPNFDLEAD